MTGKSGGCSPSHLYTDADEASKENRVIFSPRESALINRQDLQLNTQYGAREDVRALGLEEGGRLSAVIGHRATAQQANMTLLVPGNNAIQAE